MGLFETPARRRLACAQAETFANTVNGELHNLITATRHFAAVLYAPGDVCVDDGNGRGKTKFPPTSLRVAFQVVPTANPSTTPPRH